MHDVIEIYYSTLQIYSSNLMMSFSYRLLHRRAFAIAMKTSPQAERREVSMWGPKNKGEKTVRFFVYLMKANH